MRKIIAFILAIMLVASMTVSAFAVTPKLSVPKVPAVSKISMKIDLTDSFRAYWASHLIKLN